MPTRNVLLICLVSMISFLCHRTASRSRYAVVISDAINIVDGYYVDKVDAEVLFRDAMNGMIQGLDPYSSFISSDDYNAFQETLEQEFGGIGIVVEQDRETGKLMVMTPVLDTPAFRAGLRAGDVIVEIEGQPALGMTTKDAVKIMRGRPGTKVRLAVARAGEQAPLAFELQRAVIPIRSVLGDSRSADGNWRFVLESHPTIGYIRVTSFGSDTAHELKAALDQLETTPELQGVILDLRNNPGGLLVAAVNVCDLFLEQGLIVSTRGRDGLVQPPFAAKPDVRLPTSVPLVVLVNGFSASASEIVSACLQDNQRATIIGQRTWGKGTVQNVIDLEGGRCALKLTTAKYWRPSGRNIHRDNDEKDTDQWGVQPDEGFDIPLTEAEFEATLEARRQRDIIRPTPESTTDPNIPNADKQLKRAIEFLEE